MAKQLTEDQFKQAISGLTINPRTINIARSVLVDGKQQRDMMKEFGLSRGAVSSSVKRVWEEHIKLEMLEMKGESLTVILPPHQAFIVKKWAAAFAARMEKKE
jgi:transposase